MPEQPVRLREVKEPQQRLRPHQNIVKENNMKTIDKTVLEGYNAGIERDRLRTGIGIIEF